MAGRSPRDVRIKRQSSLFTRSGSSRLRRRGFGPATGDHPDDNNQTCDGKTAHFVSPYSANDRSLIRQAAWANRSRINIAGSAV